MSLRCPSRFLAPLSKCPSLTKSMRRRRRKRIPRKRRSFGDVAKRKAKSSVINQPKKIAQLQRLCIHVGQCSTPMMFSKASSWLMAALAFSKVEPGAGRIFGSRLLVMTIARITQCCPGLWKSNRVRLHYPFTGTKGSRSDRKTYWFYHGPVLGFTAPVTKQNFPSLLLDTEARSFLLMFAFQTALFQCQIEIQRSDCTSCFDIAKLKSQSCV